MPYADNHGVHIYYEVEGQGPPLMMAHGLTGDLNHFRRFGYVTELSRHFTVIPFDARGHGKSDKPNDSSAYGMNMADDVIAVMDSVKLSWTHYFGYSLGAAVGLLAAIRYPSLFNSLVVGGEARGVYNTIEAQKDNDAILAGMKLLRTDPGSYLLWREQRMGRPLLVEEKTALLRNDAAALAPLVESLAPESTPAISNRELARMPMPVLLYCGELDVRYSGSKEAAANTPNAKFVPIPGTDHFTAFTRADLVLPHIKEFLAGVSKT
jgi:pimeloyl-ACP methyl ester carboxylesterase